MMANKRENPLTNYSNTLLTDALTAKRAKAAAVTTTTE